MAGAEIAERFEAANAEAIDYVLGPAREHWDAPTAAEGWPVGVTARHIGLGHELMTSWARAIKTREPLTSVGDIHAINAEHAARGVVATPEEVVELLRRGGASVSAALRELTDDDLAQQVDFGGQQMPATMLAEASVRHVEGHLGSIKAVC
jgi:hypothetical protein